MSQAENSAGIPASVIRLADCDRSALGGLLQCYGLHLEAVAPGVAIAGSHWGGAEAGLIDNRVLARPDTPLHSVLHEACHFICMDKDRRQRLHTDAGGGYDEESAVCYLQILLADELRGFGRDRMCRDMDAWGYTFRLGSAQVWFDQDADDARGWLMSKRLIDPAGRPTWRVRS